MATQRYTVQWQEAHLTLAAFLKQVMKIPWSRIKRRIEGGQVRVARQVVRDPATRLKKGKSVEVEVDGPGKVAAPASGGRQPSESPVGKTRGADAPRSPKPADRPKRSPLERYTGPRPEILYSDESVIVVDKPVGLTTNRAGDEKESTGGRQRFLPVTLAEILPELVGRPNRRVYPAHRLDRDTSGVLVFARTVAAEAELLKQFRDHSAERLYRAVVRGKLAESNVTIESWLVADRGDGRRGSGDPATPGQSAVTHAKRVELLGEYSLVECRLETGRTHQVRIHLGEHGCPLCGETVYDRPIDGAPVADESGAGRPMLHARRLAFTHPASGERMAFDAPPPADFRGLVERLKAATSTAAELPD